MKQATSLVCISSNVKNVANKSEAR